MAPRLHIFLFLQLVNSPTDDGVQFQQLVDSHRFTDSQIMAILKQAESGMPVPELCREHGMSSARFYKWRAKFGGMDTSMIKRMKELEDENRRLKKMYAEERLKAELRKEALEGKW